MKISEAPLHKFPKRTYVNKGNAKCSVPFAYDLDLCPPKSNIYIPSVFCYDKYRKILTFNFR